MDDAGQVTENGEQDIDEEVGTAAALKEDTEGREDDRQDDLEDIASRESHCGLWVQVCFAGVKVVEEICDW